MYTTRPELRVSLAGVLAGHFRNLTAVAVPGTGVRVAAWLWRSVFDRHPACWRQSWRMHGNHGNDHVRLHAHRRTGT